MLCAACRLIAEFGEDMFDRMREQVSVELAMREFEFTSASKVPMFDSPGKTPTKSYFPEAGLKATRSPSRSPRGKSGGTVTCPIPAAAATHTHTSTICYLLD